VATKSGQQEPEKAEVVEELLDALDTALDRVKVLYEQYFLGIQKQPPTYLHTDAERQIRDLTQLQVRNTALRYRFATLQQKYGSYNAYWRRTLRQIENGTYTRNLSKIGRQAGRTGAAVPEEILAAMPKRMREQVKRDREAALALAALRPGSSDELELLTLADEAADIDDPDLVAFVHEPTERRRSALTAGGAYRIDEADADFDLDAFFASVTNEGEPSPAESPGPAARAAPVSPPSGLVDAPVIRWRAPTSQVAPLPPQEARSGARIGHPRPGSASGTQRAQPSTVNEPPRAVIVPPSAVTVPPSSAAVPPRVATVPPSVAPAPPSVAPAPPSVATEPPSAVTDPPSAVTVPPSAVTGPPSAVIVPPSAVTGPPSAVIVPPSAVTGPPPVPRPVPPRVAPPPHVVTPPAGITGAQARVAPPPHVVTPPAGVTAAQASPGTSDLSPPKPVTPKPATLAPSQTTRPIPVLPGASAARAPAAVETLAGPFPRIPSPPPLPSKRRAASGEPPAAGERPASVDHAPPTPPADPATPPRSPSVSARASSGERPPVPAGKRPSVPARVAASEPAPAPARVPPSEPPPRVAPSEPPTLRPMAPRSERPAPITRQILPPGMSKADVDALYAKYVKAKQALGEEAGEGAYGKLIKTINAQAPKIMEQYKSAGVDFSVVVKDNQVIIRAKPKP
jgi:hypothetical protein